MLGVEEGDELYTRRPQPLGIRDTGGIDAGLMAHQSHPAPAEQLQAVGQQDVDPRLDRRRWRQD
jgi:hypothetical protein